MILIGPPGAGKGTQAKLLETRFRVPHISSGDLLRAEVRRKSPLGLQAKRYMDRGDLVPDEVLLNVIAARVGDGDAANGFILDGFPRTVPQADSLDGMLRNLNTRLEHAVSIRVPRDDLVKRLSGRRTCRNCGTMYHIIFDPPSNPGICNKCNGELYQRDDDQEDLIIARLEVYDRETAPLLTAYQQRGLLREINGVGSRDAVFTRILEQVDAHA